MWKTAGHRANVRLIFGMSGRIWDLAGQIDRQEFGEDLRFYHYFKLKFLVFVLAFVMLSVNS